MDIAPELVAATEAVDRCRLVVGRQQGRRRRAGREGRCDVADPQCRIPTRYLRGMGVKERKLDMSLQIGSQGKFVADAQRALKRNGFASVDRAGVFGGSTADSVRAFQSARGLQATGVVDQSTWRALGLPGSVPRPVPID